MKFPELPKTGTIKKEGLLKGEENESPHNTNLLKNET